MKIKAYFALAGTVLALSSASARAEELFPISVNESGLALLDKESLIDVLGSKRIWSYAISPVSDGATTDRLPYVASFIEFDCLQGRFRNYNMKIVRSDGEFLREFKTPGEWNVGLPDAPATLALKIVCSGEWNAAASMKGQSLTNAIMGYRQLVAQRSGAAGRQR